MPKQLFAKRFYPIKRVAQNLTPEQCLANFVNRHQLDLKDVIICTLDNKPCLFYWSEKELEEKLF